MKAEQMIEALGLRPHPEEGGYYRETYRSPRCYTPGPPYDGPRAECTAIYYLLTPDTYSALHRLPGDEIFHFYAGDPVDMLMLHPSGESEVVRLGQAPGLRMQHIVPGGTWQGSRLAARGAWALLGTTMSPGFEFEDYESALGHDLGSLYAERRDMVQGLMPRHG